MPDNLKYAKQLLNSTYGAQQKKSFSLILLKNRLIYFLKYRLFKERWIYADTDSIKTEREEWVNFAEDLMPIIDDAEREGKNV